MKDKIKQVIAELRNGYDDIPRSWRLVIYGLATVAIAGLLS